MEFVAYQCPSCSATLEVAADAASYTCKFCGSNGVLKKTTMAPASYEEKELQKAQTAWERGHTQDAYNIYSALVEKDPTNVPALLGQYKAVVQLDSNECLKMPPVPLILYAGEYSALAKYSPLELVEQLQKTFEEREGYEKMISEEYRSAPIKLYRNGILLLLLLAGILCIFFGGLVYQSKLALILGLGLLAGAVAQMIWQYRITGVQNDAVRSELRAKIEKIHVKIIDCNQKTLDVIEQWELQN